MHTRFFVRPGENERISADVTLAPDRRSILQGTVKNPDGVPLEGALVLLMETGAPDTESKFHTASFTDEDGQYYFGPLQPGQLYMVKVYHHSIKIRELEILADEI